MQVHADKQVQYSSSNRLQGSTSHPDSTTKRVTAAYYTFRKTGHPVEQGGYQGLEQTTTADTLNVYDNSENENSHSDRGADSEIFIIDRASFNQGENAKYDIEIHRGGAVPTIVARGPHAVAVPVLRGTRSEHYVQQITNGCNRSK
jgi:hypothetical protein